LLGTGRAEYVEDEHVALPIVKATHLKFWGWGR
jgi:hypothetical protein